MHNIICFLLSHMFYDRNPYIKLFAICMSICMDYRFGFLYCDWLDIMPVGTYQYIAKIPNLMIHIKNEPLKKVSIAKYLRMYIDENLNWDEHINVTIPKISANIDILISRRRIVPIDTLKLLYNAIVFD